jgi:hypothetical protein
LRACSRGKEERGDATLDAIEAAYTDLIACAQQISPPLRHLAPVRCEAAAVPATR